MKISKVPLLSLLQSVLALVLGFVAVTLVTVAGATLVNAVLPGSVGAEGIPLTAPAQMLFLPILFLAGMSGAFVVVLVTRHRPGMLAVVFGVLAVVGDILAGIEYATLWPLWFSALVVLTVPPQVWLGAVLGLRARRRWARRTDAGAGAAAPGPPASQTSRETAAGELPWWESAPQNLPSSV